MSLLSNLLLVCIDVYEICSRFKHLLYYELHYHNMFLDFIHLHASLLNPIPNVKKITVFQTGRATLCGLMAHFNNLHQQRKHALSF